MPLSLGVSTGDKLTVGPHDLSVKKVVNPTTIVISVDDGPEIIITEFERTQILRNVFVFAGVGANGNGSRLAFDAPRNVSIHRAGMIPSLRAQ